MKLTLEYGIDLGTTNSAIALQTSDKPSLLPDADGEDILPSIVHVSTTGEILIGNVAKSLADTDPENTKAEFKRLMGTSEVFHFPRSGKTYLPEELSAFVLQNLIARTQGLHSGEPVRAAVITIPAMFQLPQNDATRKAAQLAGIEHAILLQEPIAAAVAHASATLKNEGNWLIYDLGGGTFDVSLVRSKAGRLQVLDHDGDNQLGGKDLDRMVVNEIARQIREQWGIDDLQRSNPTYRQLFAQLKLAAEKARIELSAREQTRLLIDMSKLSGKGFFETTLVREQLEQIIEPTIQRSIRLCKKVLEKNNLYPHELNGIVLVGGPTLTPCLPTMLEQGIGAEARHVMNPISIVAYGAAVYASTQKLPDHLRGKSVERNPVFPEAATIDLQLNYEPMTTNPRPFLAGRVAQVPPGVPTPKSVRAERLDGGFDTGLTDFNSSGAFMLGLILRPNALNTFRLHLSGGVGIPSLEASPAEFTILHGLSVGQPPLSQSVGIMLADNTVAWYIRKGAALPAEKTLSLHTNVTLKEGQSGEAVHVPLVQGESERADRNKTIGVLKIYAEHIRHDLPLGSEVQVTLSVDAFSQTLARAYVPALDQWFEDIVRFDIEIKKPVEMTASLAQQNNRLAELEALAAQLSGEEPEEGSDTGSPEQDERLAQIEDLINEDDTDSRLIAEKLIREMTDELDHREDATKTEKMALTFREQTEWIEKDLKQAMTSNQWREAQALKKEYNEAMNAGDDEAAHNKLTQLETLNRETFVQTDDFIKQVFVSLYYRFQENPSSESTLLIARGTIAFESGNINELRRICGGLISLLPEGDQTQEDEQIKRMLSNVNL